MSKPLFIYFRHTPKQIRFIVSYDLTPKGESKILIRRNDNNAGFAEHLLNCIKIVIRNQGGFSPRYRPDFGAIVKHLTDGSITQSKDGVAGQLCPTMVELMSNDVFEKIIHIPSDGKMGERIMCVPKKEG